MGAEALAADQMNDLEASRLESAPVDIAPDQPLVEAADCDWELVRTLRRELGLHSLAAQAMVRRGVASLEDARSALDPGSANDPETLPGVGAAADAILVHVKLGSRIAVHGDYDVDGVCSTAILVRTLSTLGADVTWHVPSRFGDGYGLTRASVDRLAGAGAQLIITVDCGIGSVAEVAHAKSLGVDVVICDHHTIGPELPDCPVVHPGLEGYPDPFICAAAATHKLASVLTARAGSGHDQLDDDLAMVALATVCDVVPLRGENRALVREGLARLRSTQRPGLRELMRVAGVDQLKLDAGALGFALGPRINAAGRMHSAEPAVELMLATSEQRAAELAGSLGAANHRRREIEQETLQAAEGQAREQRDQFAIVVAGEGWHPGVLGIVAGRLAERFRRPAIALAIEGDVAAGSGRSGGRYDLHAGLEECAQLLVRYGGHRAAAGLELDLDRLGEFRSAFVADATRQLTIDDLRPRMVVDAIGSPADINLQTIEELERLGPFGAENPRPQVLIPAAELVSVNRMGRSGQHFKLAIAGDSARAAVVAFRQERVIDGQDVPRHVDLVVELQRNEFNGREEAQAVMRGLIERSESRAQLWNRECEQALADGLVEPGEGIDETNSRDLREEGPVLALLELAAPDSRIALAVNDPEGWRGAFAGVLSELVARSSVEVLGYDDPRLAGGGFDLVLMAEPPPTPELASFGSAEAVACWSLQSELRAIERADDLLLSREHLVSAFRVIRETDSDIESLFRALNAALPSARIAGRSLRALEEIDVIAIERSGETVDAVIARDSGAQSGAKRDLDQSFTFRSYSGYREASQQWLRSLNTPRTQR